jgi:hypothetical protein
MSVDGTANSFAPPGVFLGDHDRRRRRPARVGRWRLAFFLLLAGAALATALLTRSPDSEQKGVTTPTGFSRIGFVADERLSPMLSFRQAESGQAKVQYQARGRQSTAERWDTLTLGDVGGDDILFQVTLYLAQSAMAKPSLFVDLARQSAELNAAIIHAASPQSFATEHGSLETAEVTLSGTQADRRCLGFRLAGSQQVNVFGLACGARGAPLDAPDLGRLIDRIAPTAAGVAAGLGDIFKIAAT